MVDIINTLYRTSEQADRTDTLQIQLMVECPVRLEFLSNEKRRPGGAAFDVFGFSEA